jgi:phage terminase small subunit
MSKIAQFTTPESTLKTRQAAFVREYALTGQAKNSAIAAGYSAKTASEIAARPLKDPSVTFKLAALKNQTIAVLEDQYSISRDKELRQVAIGAFPDVRRLFNEVRLYQENH